MNQRERFDQEKTRRNWVEFIRQDIELGLTLVAVARTEIGLRDRAGATKALDKARSALDTVRRFLPKLSPEGATDLQPRIEQLRREIEEISAASE
jgi:hypothetical protein